MLPPNGGFGEYSYIEDFNGDGVDDVAVSASFANGF